MSPIVTSYYVDFEPHKRNSGVNSDFTASQTVTNGTDSQKVNFLDKHYHLNVRICLDSRTFGNVNQFFYFPKEGMKNHLLKCWSFQTYCRVLDVKPLPKIISIILEFDSVLIYHFSAQASLILKKALDWQLIERPLPTSCFRKHFWR